MKRIYKSVIVTEGDDGYSVSLDGKQVYSPGRRLLALPNLALAQAVAAEWNAQIETVDPRKMPMMSLATTAIDRVGPQRDHVIKTIASYAESDMVCYRAEEPPMLVQRQSEAWQPLLDWCAEQFDARLRIGSGIMPVRQPPEAVEAFRAVISRYEDLPMTALHELTAACGSVVIGLAIAEGRVGAEDGAAAGQLDEAHQIERWGEDEEAMARFANVRRDVLVAAEFLKLCRAWN